MKYYLSTIADVIDEWDENNKTEVIHYVHATSAVAKKYGLGLELAEFCISENCDDPSRIMDFFEENVRSNDDLLLHAPYNELFPHAIEPAVVREAEQRYDQSYKICQKYGIKKMVVHANYIQSLYFPTWFIPQQISFWKKFLAEHPGDTQIVLENVMEGLPYLITDIVKGVDDPRFKMCFDLGHANLHPEKTLDEWLEECAPYISHLHIHNNNGPSKGIAGTGDFHSALGNGIIDYDRLLKKADSLIPDLTASVESYGLEDSASWLLEHGFIEKVQ